MNAPTRIELTAAATSDLNLVDRNCEAQDSRNFEQCRGQEGS